MTIEKPSQPLRLAILGSTGSIGTRALDVVRDLGPERVEVVALVAHSSVERLAEQVREFRPALVGLTDGAATEGWDAQWPAGERPETLRGPEALIAAATAEDLDCVVVATVGSVGTHATLAALERGCTVALANKEVLVCAGDLVMAKAREHGARLMPIDSEHSAIFQSLWGHDPRGVARLLLTASGGPFRGKPLEEIRAATCQQALAHPTWEMGAKITIDSATMMNKGFEIIEAVHLFGVPETRIDVVVHPESLIHSMVEYLDGSILAQISTTDMYLPILNALTWPERIENPVPRVDFAQVGRMTFEEPDVTKFPCLRLAREAIRAGGTVPAVLNAANEVAVARFLEGQIGLLDIAALIETAMQAHEPVAEPTLDQIFEADRWARREVEERCSART